MAPLPPLTPPPPGTPGSRVRVRSRSTIPDEIVDSSGSAEIILAKLRGMIAGGRQETETILGTIAVAAHALTGANGAAIAMPYDGAVVCVGRSGDIAPELGDLLNVDSGISGECLRTGTMMRCDDASRDFHVNAEVCRQMGLQSIAVVPLRGRFGRVGVLEVVSARSYAFTEEHMDLLGRMAGLAEAAWAQAPGAQELETPLLTEEPSAQELVAEESVQEEDLQTQPLQVDSPPSAVPIQTEAVAEKSRLAGATAALTRVGAAIATGFHAELRTERRWRYGTIAGLATILLLLLAVLSWKIWYKASLPISSSRSADNPQEAVSKGPDAAAGLVWQPSTENALSRATSAPTAGIPVPGSSAIRPSASRPMKSPAVAEPIRRQILVPEASDRSDTSTTAVAEAPQVPTSGGGPTDLKSILPASPAMPRLGMPISQGVSGGTLVHKVMPVYPLEARQLHVQGTVVLQATINEHGQIEDLKLVSGSPLLAQSAMDAVRKWRYAPYLLNGKPIKKETQINISFIPE
jgi:TonB family protein